MTNHDQHRTCARCGATIIARRDRPNSVLCKDCYYVLNRAERDLWKGRTHA